MQPHQVLDRVDPQREQQVAGRHNQQVEYWVWLSVYVSLQSVLSGVYVLHLSGIYLLTWKTDTDGHIAPKLHKNVSSCVKFDVIFCFSES